MCQTFVKHFSYWFETDAVSIIRDEEIATQLKTLVQCLLYVASGRAEIHAQFS